MAESQDWKLNAEGLTHTIRHDPIVTQIVRSAPLAERSYCWLVSTPGERLLRAVTRVGELTEAREATGARHDDADDTVGTIATDGRHRV